MLLNTPEDYIQKKMICLPQNKSNIDNFLKTKLKIKLIIKFNISKYKLKKDNNEKVLLLNLDETLISRCGKSENP